MPEVADAPMFSCNSCGKQFKWKPAIAGKKARCGCGMTLTVPTNDPSIPKAVLAVEADGGVEEVDDLGLPIFGTANAGEDDNYSLAPAPVTSRPKSVLPAPAARSGTTAAALGYSRGKDKRQKELESNLSFWGAPSERKGPIWVLCVSAVIAFGAVFYQQGDPLAITFYSIAIIISVGFMVAGAFLTAMMTGINFGVLGLAIIKLSAVCLVSEAIINAAGVVDNPILYLLSYLVRFVVFYGMMVTYFELTVKEVFVTAFITFLVRFVAGFILVMALVSMRS